MDADAAARRLCCEGQDARPVGEASFREGSLIDFGQPRKVRRNLADCVARQPCKPQLRDNCGDRARKSRCVADWLVTAKPALGLQAVNDPGDDCLGAQSAKRNKLPLRKQGRGERGSQLRQGQPMPAEGSALLRRHPARQLVGRVETCPDDQHLLGQRSAFQPGARPADSTMVHGRDGDDRAHW